MNGHRGIFVERLRPLVASGDVDGAVRLLRGLEGEQLLAARQWFDSSSHWWRDVIDHGLDDGAHAGAQWILGLCAVDLCGPRTAARRIPWSSLYGLRSGNGAEDVMLTELGSRPPPWAAEFVDAASHLPPPRDRGDETLARVVRSTAVRHGLPCPTGHTFLALWLEGTALSGWPTTDEVVEWLTVDPLMPDVLLGMLGTGECGRRPDLGQIAASLVSSGHVDRDRLVEVVLEELTTPQRARSQQVLSEILSAVGLRPDEVPGGLGYVLGVLSTAHRSVQPVLLPLALALATHDEDWRELVDLVAGRPDKKAKEMVLAALKEVGPERVRREALADLLDALVTGSDAAYDAKVAKVRSALGLESAANQQVTLLGLWDLAPMPRATTRPERFSYSREPTWSAALSSREPETEDVRLWLTEQALVEMADGSHDGAEILAATGHLLGRQEFHSSAFVTAFEDLFLAGGLRQGWETALGVADRAAGAPKPPSGLADVVRLLVRYAPEVRDPVALPDHLASLAAGTSGTKAAIEARKLAATLPGPRSQAAGPPAPDESVRTPLERTGLWERPRPARAPFPSDMRIGEDPIADRAATLPGLRALLSEDFNGWAQSFADVCFRPDGWMENPSLTGLTEPDRVLAATVEAVERHGATSVRETLQDIERTYRPIDLVVAVDAWAAGDLDPSTFWRLASVPVVSESALLETWREQGVPGEEARARRDALPAFAERLRRPVDPEHGALVVPSELSPPAHRFAFLRAAEALIRAEAEPVVLSTPTWRDGTLEVCDLIARLARVARGTGVVGPLDLVQALHRLRDVDARLVDQVPSGLRTDPRFTDPEGVQEWDATELVQRWLGLGGLPALEPRARDGRWEGPPASPVPFATLAAWPTDLARDPWCPGPPPSALRLHPGWADRTFEGAFESVMVFEPRSLPSLGRAPFGVPFHDRLLANLCPEHNQARFYASSTLLFLAESGRIDPEAAAAAASGRHEAGTLSLSLLVKTFQRELEHALPVLWPTGLAIADGLSGVAKRPPHLVELLRLLTSYAHEVPSPAAAVPPAVLALAASKGSTKAHEAARELVSALRRAATA